MKKIIKIIKDNILGFILGAILFGGIGTVVATTILSSSVSYTNNNQTTVEGALNELYGMVNIACYNGTCGKLAFRYWNDDFEFAQHYYNHNALPDTYYNKLELLQSAYNNFVNNPYYIRSILIDGNAVGHQACLWYNNHEFCLSPNYWAGTIGTSSANAGTQTMIKLQRDMENALGITLTNCTNNAREATCNIGSFSCTSNNSSEVQCQGSYGYCTVDSSNARCTVWEGD